MRGHGDGARGLIMIASVSLGGVLLAAGVGVPLAVAGIVVARWDRSRVHPIGPGLTIAEMTVGLA